MQRLRRRLERRTKVADVARSKPLKRKADQRQLCLLEREMRMWELIFRRRVTTRGRVSGDEAGLVGIVTVRRSRCLQGRVLALPTRDVKAKAML
ncbi:hypothetical protein PIB30_047250 [Stylosanthes scabra]|uniref:Ribosomal protein S14 n=1 Tax=Stylosanthes scabra TaxID=79078 RepID=A0ABU6ZFG8_9FABA|nr:hypothetical protein [Stylosanthes scabra]